MTNLNADEAAAYLGGAPITANTVRALARRRELGHVRIGRTIVFPTTELDAYVEAHTVKPTENPWGLTDSALRTVREGRATTRKAS